MNYQHSAIKGAKVTLPSVEGGFGTLNIIRDPPKSVYTRFKEKVTDTNKITEWIDGSGDRVCESVLKFSRGINPMVSVSYSNTGTNGGQSRYREGNASAQTNPFTSGQSYLPYRIMRDGAFRPPVISPQQLLPLSRQPRGNISQFTNKGTVWQTSDFEKCGSIDLKSVREQLIHFCAPTKPSYSIQVPHTKPYETDNMIKDKTNVSIIVNKNDSTRNVIQDNLNPDRGIKERTLIGDIITNLHNPSVEVQQDRRDPDRGIKTYTLHGDWTANKTDSTVYISQGIRDPERGIKDCVLSGEVTAAKTKNKVQLQTSERDPDRGIKSTILQGPVTTNINSNERSTTPIIQFAGNQGVSTQNRVKGVIRTNTIGVENHSLMHENNYYLPEKVSAGGFINSGYQPQLSR
jgi:hypothetical protein